MFHEVTIIGNLGNAPDLRYLPDGTAVCNFSVAATEKWKDKGGNPQERVIWFRVSVWGNTAENVNQYMTKGRQIFVKGALKPGDNGSPRTFDRNDGSTGASYEVTAHTVKFLGGKGNAAPAQDDSDDDPF